MNRETMRQYGRIKLLDIECDRPYDWDEADATHIRVSVPPAYQTETQMLRRGFFPADRTLGVSVNLARSGVDYGSLVRMEPVRTSDRRGDVLAIARQSFPTDRRFNLTREPDPAVAGTVLSVWVEELEEYYLCEHKGQAIGFLALTGEGERRFVHLAAVAERYRTSPAGLSLYAAAARDCRQAGVQWLQGRVSSANTAVMNLYARLGAVFSEPLDVYLREV